MTGSAKFSLIVAAAALLLSLFTLFYSRIIQTVDLAVSFRNGAYARVEPGKDNVVLNSRIVAVFANGGSVPALVDGVELILGDGTDPRKNACEDRLWTFALYSPPFSVSSGEVLVKTIDSFDEVLSRSNEGVAYGELANGPLPRDFLVCVRFRLDNPSHDPSYKTIALSSTHVVDRKTISSKPLLPEGAVGLVRKVSLFGAW